MKYEVKKEHLKHYCLLVGEVYNSPNSLVMGAQFLSCGEHYRILRDAGVLDLWCYEVKEVESWKEPSFISCIECGASIGSHAKADLLIRMQSWADYHNKLDVFVVDWSGDSVFKWGITLENLEAGEQYNRFANIFLFQIAVSSKERAKAMLKYFRKDIKSLIDKGLI